LQLEPLARPLDRLGSHARGLAQRLGKGQVELEIGDGGLLGDPRTAAPLWNVLVHLVRNAVDHGLELPEERRAAGKHDPPRLSLSATRQGRSIVIEIADDGRGVDWQRVRELAERRHLAASCRAELVRVLFSPDLSTRSEVSATSGRGVGLAAVAEEVERLGGSIELDSELGQGCRFQVKVPAEALGVADDSPASERRPTRPPAAVGERHSA
jgi:two-component system chemotaxis sensor kinase CheA